MRLRRDVLILTLFLTFLSLFNQRLASISCGFFCLGDNSAGQYFELGYPFSLFTWKIPPGSPFYPTPLVKDENDTVVSHKFPFREFAKTPYLYSYFYSTGVIYNVVFWFLISLALVKLKSASAKNLPANLSKFLLFTGGAIPLLLGLIPITSGNLPIQSGVPFAYLRRLTLPSPRGYSDNFYFEPYGLFLDYLIYTCTLFVCAISLKKILNRPLNLQVK